MPLPPRCRILIFDIGHVLFTYHHVTSTSIAPNMLKSLLSSTIWREYERGRVSEDECYRLIAEKFTLDEGVFRQAILGVRESLNPDDAFIRFVRELHSEANGGLRIFAMSNISAPDYVVTRGKLADWSVFERVFTSADAGMRKPDLSFYKFVLDEIKAEPSSVTFIDDNIENVLAARSLGIHAIVFDDPKRVRQTLRYVVGDPVSRGLAFLEERAGRLDSESSLGHNVAENLTQLLIFEATGNKNLVNYVHHPRTWGFYRENPMLGTTGELPPDLDTTSIALTVTRPDDHVVHEVLDEMLQYVTQDGMAMTYFDAEQPYTDPIVSLNVLTLFYSHGRGHELSNTLDWLLGLLEHRAYLDGTRHYETAECFLFFSARLLRSSSTPDAPLHARLAPLLRARILERAGCPGDALALAMRVLAGAALGLRMERDLAALLPLQCEDGGWELGWLHKQLHASRGKIGNRGLTTALALNAIAALHPQPAPAPPPPPPPAQERGTRANLKKGGNTTFGIAAALEPQLRVTTVLPELAATGLPSPL